MYLWITALPVSVPPSPNVHSNDIIFAFVDVKLKIAVEFLQITVSAALKSAPAIKIKTTCVCYFLESFKANFGTTYLYDFEQTWLKFLLGSGTELILLTGSIPYCCTTAKYICFRKPRFRKSWDIGFHCIHRRYALSPY